MKSELQDLKKIVKGNGQKGLQQNVIELNTNVPLLTSSVKELSCKVQTLIEKDIAASTERAIKLSAKQKLTAIITGIIGGSTVIIMALDLILKNR